MAEPRGGLVVGFLAGLLAGCAAGPVSEPSPVSQSSTVSERSMVTTAANGAREEVPVTISKPDGPGPFPVVVIMHDCSGLGPGPAGPRSAGPACCAPVATSP